MNEQITRQVQDMLTAAAKTEVPAEIRALAQDNVAKAREAFDQWNATAHKGAKALEEALRAAETGVKAISEKALGHAQTNAEAAFEAARGLARARTLPEAAQLQAKFVQEQLAAVTEQGKALFELSVAVGRETTEALTAIATTAVAGKRTA